MTSPSCEPPIREQADGLRSGPRWLLLQGEPLTRRPGTSGTASGGRSPRTGSPHTSHAHSVAMSETRSPRLTMPTSRPAASTGTRRIRRSTSRCRTSSTLVLSVTLTTAVVITSRAAGPDLASRSYSLTSPTTPPVSSTTGTALIRCRRSACAMSASGVSAGTVTTGVVMISPAVAAVIALPTQVPRRPPFPHCTAGARSERGLTGAEMGCLAGSQADL